MIRDREREGRKRDKERERASEDRRGRVERGIREITLDKELLP